MSLEEAIAIIEGHDVDGSIRHTTNVLVDNWINNDPHNEIRDAAIVIMDNLTRVQMIAVAFNNRIHG